MSHFSGKKNPGRAIARQDFSASCATALPCLDTTVYNIQRLRAPKSFK